MRTVLRSKPVNPAMSVIERPLPGHGANLVHVPTSQQSSHLLLAKDLVTPILLRRGFLLQRCGTSPPPSVTPKPGTLSESRADWGRQRSNGSTDDAGGDGGFHSPSIQSGQDTRDLGRGSRAQCPVHDADGSGKPDRSLKEADDGVFLVHRFVCGPAGQDALIEALRMRAEQSRGLLGEVLEFLESDVVFPSPHAAVAVTLWTADGGASATNSAGCAAGFAI